MIDFKTFIEKKNFHELKNKVINLIVSLNDWIEKSEKNIINETKNDINQNKDENLLDSPRIKKVQSQKEKENVKRRERYFTQQKQKQPNIKIGQSDLEIKKHPKPETIESEEEMSSRGVEQELKLQQTPKEIKADEWYKMVLGKIKSELPPKAKSVRNYKKTRTVLLGRIYAFEYEPKHKRILKYFDENPLVLTFDFKKGQVSQGFLGINFHYVPKRHRKYVLDFFMKNNIDQVMNTGKIDIDYTKIKHNIKYPYLKYCIRMYLINHVKGNLYMVPPEEYIWVLNLHSPRFVGMSEQQILNALKNARAAEIASTPGVERVRKKREERNIKRRKIQPQQPEVKSNKKEFKVGVFPTYKRNKKQITGNV